MSPRLHTVFVQVQVHTAKCDLCENHNKLTLYRCTECGQHVCSVCWKKQSRDGIHVFNGGVAGGPDFSADRAVDDDGTGGERDDESQGRTRTRRRARVMSDDEDDDVPMLSRAASTTANEGVDQVTQRNFHIQGQESELNRQRMAQAHDGPERQAAPTRYVFVDGQQNTRQARHQILPNGPHQQATQLPPLRIQPAVYRPRPGADVDRQAAHNQLAFANRPHTHHQAPRPAPASISRQHAQTAHMAQIAARNQQAFRLNQQLSAYANTEQMEARNRQVFLHQNTRLVVNGDQVVAQNQRVVNLSGLSSAAANHVVQMLAARNRQEDYLVRQQANQSNPDRAQTSASHGNTSLLPAHPHPGPAPNSASHGNTSPLPAQAFVSAQHQQHTAPQASRQFQHRVTIQDILNEPSEGVQVRKRSPEILEAADLPLAYAEVEQVPGVRSHSDQDANGVSQLLSAADQLDEAGSASSEPRSSSKKFVAESEAAGTKSVSPRGRPNYGHASLQPDPGLVRNESSAAQSRHSTPRGDQSHPGPRLPISDHAATYLNQWNSGRAALSRSPVPALYPRSNTGVQDTVAVGTKDGEAAEVSSPALGSPMSVTEGPVGVDVVMIDPDVEILEHEETRRYKEYAVNNNPWTMGMAKGAEKARARAAEPISGLHSNGRVEKHQRGEKKGDHKTSKEQKASDDIDVVGARGRNGKEVHSEQVDDDGSDIEITSWKDLHGNKTTGKHQGTKAGAKGPETSRTLKKGVAQIKKPERKGQKGKTPAA